jgi:adenosine deaminase
MEDFIRLMPKCEMHLHIEGTLEPALRAGWPIETSWAPPAVRQEFLDRLAAL